ncbi:hypothetical protein CNMCM5793_000755 [Aspergillus hiratsukae]|uniref:BTB domain-containing protein n=1 Tax=Aspergillus hiratsukae TaxID=1194566 RepID=A0A8H6Q2V0_9EURO|nr:hypothetical protein CNMCM5793_000755 [Aspergillus hiratsukae]KAF7166126.1 hypothetical protein CNMCM6106_002084 [Aspergillus hiratsukae]
MEALVLGSFLNPKYSDLTIFCDGEDFPAHRNIVCPQSKYFEAACDGRFKEGDGKIRLDGHNPTLVKKTLEFLYTGDYTYEDPLNDSLSKAEIELFSQNEAESMANLRTGEAYFHAQMYAQGDYFQIDALKSKAKQRFEDSFMMDPFDGDSFTSAVIEVYTSTAENDRGLRDPLVQLTINKLYVLRASRNLILDDNLVEREMGEAATSSNAEFCSHSNW